VAQPVFDPGWKRPAHCVSLLHKGQALSADLLHNGIPAHVQPKLESGLIVQLIKPLEQRSFVIAGQDHSAVEARVATLRKLKAADGPRASVDEVSQKDNGPRGSDLVGLGSQVAEQRPQQIRAAVNVSDCEDMAFRGGRVWEQPPRR
jgi:hypothetical protein